MRIFSVLIRLVRAIGRHPSVLGFFPLLPLLRYLLISSISTVVSYTIVHAATWWWAPYSDKEPREDAKRALD